MTDEAIAAAFEEHRALLLSVAYRMLGSLAEAEDVVQDAYLRVHRGRLDAAESPRAYLVTVVTRLCLDALKSARRTRESYIGPWLPEPLVTDEADPRFSPAARYGQRESLSMAFLLLLEQLSPVERATLVLRDAFEYGYAEIAAMLGRSEAALRQAHHRARARLRRNQPRVRADAGAARELLGRFLAACETGDTGALSRCLTADAVSWSDGGGKRPAAYRLVVGRSNVARLVAAIFRRDVAGRPAEAVEINGLPGFIVGDGAAPDSVTLFEVTPDGIAAIYSVVNPEKLAGLARPPAR